MKSVDLASRQVLPLVFPMTKSEQAQIEVDPTASSDPWLISAMGAWFQPHPIRKPNRPAGAWTPGGRVGWA